MSDRIYKTAFDLAREKRDFALMHLLDTHSIDQRPGRIQGALMRALTSYDDNASFALIQIFAAAITDNVVKGRLMINKTRNVHVLQPQPEMGFAASVDEDDLYDHKHDEVARALMSLYPNVPLLAPREGRMMVSQDESEMHVFHVGCLEKTKQAIFEILADRWARSSNPSFPFDILRFFWNLPFEVADSTTGDKGKSRDRELALNALRNRMAIRGSALTQDIETLISDISDDGGLLIDEDYWSDLLTILAIGRIKAMRPAQRFLELKKTCNAD